MVEFGMPLEPEWLEVLCKSTLFVDITSVELESMLRCLRSSVGKYSKNEYIRVAGEHHAEVGIVLSGKTAIVKDSLQGDRVIVAVLQPGDLFGEMVAFSEKRVWPATVMAQEDCVVMFIPSERIVDNCERRCECHRDLLMNLLRVLSDKALMLNRKVEYLTIKSLRGKISVFLLECHEKTGKMMFMLPLSRNELAEFLNVSRPSLSREMCRMRDEGLIEFHMSSVRLNDVAGLRDAMD